MKKSIPTQQTKENIEAVMAILAQTSQKLEAISKGLSENSSQLALGEGERSLTETIAHLINSEARTAEGIQLALLLNEPLVHNIHSERDWGKLMQFENFSFSELLSYFQFRRKILLSLLNRLSEAQWGKVIREEAKQRKESVYLQARSLALHELEHLDDLEAKKHLIEK